MSAVLQKITAPPDGQNAEMEKAPSGPEAVGERIRIARKSTGKNQTEVAVSVGLERSAVSNWEQGRTSPSLSMINQLAELLDVDLMWLAFGVRMSEVADGVVVPVMEVGPDGELVRVDDRFVGRVDLMDSSGARLQTDNLIAMVTDYDDDLGGAGKLVLIDTSKNVPAKATAMYAVGHKNGWFAARMAQAPVGEEKVSMFSEKLRLDKTDDLSNINVIGRVELVLLQRIS